ncbi:MAG TPA: T9SS type A sorting domain-containing protein [Bacteroidales bacterium]|nr:T9SS type A sorting domain-containing protein [Bacteroidales bacterium]
MRPNRCSCSDRSDDVTSYKLESAKLQTSHNWWFYRNSGAYIPSENPNLFPYIQIMPAYNPVSVNCASCTYGYQMAGNYVQNINQINYPQTGGPEFTEMDAIMSESNFYNELDESFKYFEKQYAYDVLANAGTIDIQAEGEFLNELANGNIGKFSRVYGMILREQYDSASFLNNSVSPVNQIEINRKWVNEVYLSYVVPQTTIPQSTIDKLEILESSSPFVNGDAVYTARAIVCYTEPVMNNRNMEGDNQQAETDTNTTVEVHVYPNPSQGNITVEVIGLHDELCKFVIRNALGINLYEKAIKANGLLLSIDLGRLSNGIYFYELISAEKVVIDKGRIVINK